MLLKTRLKEFIPCEHTISTGSLWHILTERSYWTQAEPLCACSGGALNTIVRGTTQKEAAHCCTNAKQ